MEAFGDDYVVHNLPLLLVCGLGNAPLAGTQTASHPGPPLQEGGFRISIDLPDLQGHLPELVLSALSGHDGSQAPWKAQDPIKGLKLFRTKLVGRAFSLPARKAPPPPQTPKSSSGGDSDGAPAPLVLHSPLSPLTPSSPLYPDGLMSRLWIVKHQCHLPAAVLVFFTLTADANTSSLLDNKTKTEINDIRSTLASTHYKTRLVVVLLGDGPIDASDIEDRLSLIRKAASLDSKSLYFCPYNSSEVEVDGFIRSMLSAVYPNCIEYYRDLSKHARRKRNRGSVPQPTIPSPGSHGLSFQGWNARYEFKLGVFAEFRQEMEAACRNYEQAYEQLFSSEVLESIPVWDARFDEARLLADVIAIRIIRCFLWSGHSTSAVRAWSSHRNRLREFLDQRGKGTENYEWETWQSLWAKAMAQLITKAELPTLNVTSPELSSSDLVSVYAGPEKSTALGERWTPWEYLAHEGYWLDMAQKFTNARRQRAAELPDDQRMEQPKHRPSNGRISTGSYLCPAPYEEVPAGGTGGFNYTASIAADLDAAIRYFESRGQVRKVQFLLLKKGLEFFRASDWSGAATILEPLWKSQLWRAAGWWKLLQSVGLALLECAQKLHSARLIVELSWELGNGSFDIKSEADVLARGLTLEDEAAGAANAEDRLSISIDANSYASQVSPSFAFARPDCPVGELVESQLVLFCTARPGSAAVLLKAVKIVFEGGLKSIQLSHDEHLSSSKGDPDNISAVDVALQESSDQSTGPVGIASLIGQADLLLRPGQTRVFNLVMTPREAGEMSVSMITLIVEEARYNLAATWSNFENEVNQWFETKGGRPISRPIGPDRDVYTLQVLPKAPKVEIHALNFKDAYYTNEEISIDIEIVNSEDEAATISIEARLISPVPGGAKISWADSNRSRLAAESAEQNEDDMVQHLAAKDLGTIETAGKTTTSIVISEAVAALDHELEVSVSYKLQSDKGLVLQKAAVLDVVVTRPFEANYDFHPRLLKEPWPNFFDMSAAATESTSAALPPQGLRHLYQVTANLYSFATEPVIIEAVLLTATTVGGGAVASSTVGVVRDTTTTATAASDSSKRSNDNSPTTGDQISIVINPEQTRQFDLDLSVQKLVLGDRSLVSLGLWLEIGWRRLNSDKVNTTLLEVPPLQISMSEPRVLLTVEKQQQHLREGTEENYDDDDDDSDDDGSLTSYKLTYTIENPSMHLLTFNITMDASEDFAFSGARAVVVSLTPVSRYDVHYLLIPKKPRQQQQQQGKLDGGDVGGEWVKVKFNVVDAYFNQMLRVLPANGGGATTEEGGGEQQGRLVKMDKKTGDVYVWFD